MMKRLAIIGLLFLPLAAVGQNAKSEPLFEQAVEKSVAGQHEEAIKLLHKAIDIDPTYSEAYLLLGNQHLALKQYTTAHDCYSRALALAEQRGELQWAKESREGMRTAEWRQHAVDNPVPFKPINLGPNVNTADDEYLPALTADYRTPRLDIDSLPDFQTWIRKK